MSNESAQLTSDILVSARECMVFLGLSITVTKNETIHHHQLFKNMTNKMNLIINIKTYMIYTVYNLLCFHKQFKNYDLIKTVVSLMQY